MHTLTNGVRHMENSIPQSYTNTMNQEDAIEDAEEKGWSETLVFHEMFDILRDKEIITDQKVSVFV